MCMCACGSRFLCACLHRHAHDNGYACATRRSRLLVAQESARAEVDARNRAEWSQLAARNHTEQFAAGAARSRRAEQSRLELLEKRKKEVTSAMREREERAAVEREEAVRHLHENRQRVDRVREETHSSVAASSARMFYQGRVHTADIVRNARNGWTTAREATRNAFVARAKERARAEQARLQADSVNDGREALAAKRHEDAEAMRASIAHIEARDKHLRLADETRKRAAHDAHFESARRSLATPTATSDAMCTRVCPTRLSAIPLSLCHKVRHPEGVRGCFLRSLLPSCPTLDRQTPYHGTAPACATLWARNGHALQPQCMPASSACIRLSL